MTILGTIDRFINLAPKDIIEEKIIYLELSVAAYEALRQECETNYTLSGIAKVTDMGDKACFWIQYNGYKIIIVLNQNLKESPDFYIAFKTKII